MTNFKAPNPDFEARVRESFAWQKLMETIGARLTEVLPGRIVVEMPYRPDLTQQHGFVHAGIVTAIVDTACGYAALSLMPAGADVLSVEYKVNFLSPAKGEKLIALGRVIKSGRTITVCEGKVSMETEGREKVIATMLATMINPG